ncbi:MAG: phospholipid/cholesterol/gamma-HCH transport system substrate-binding protein [Nocardioidaceae bacterium]|jgi:phospholipid/cholesterol/gamma-HCH transport system substrate-binding protein|nr:phospholipid/cholesterol/gamma-HCH transport system substrate-binding protein [Nocardioidaceae bacterium]
MRSFRDRNPYAVGIVSLLLLGTITGFAFLVGLNHLLEHAYEMHGTFTDASGLRVGDDVKVAGIKVGRVTDIKADRVHGNVLVDWVVNNGVDIRDEAGADIALETLLGSKYIRITDPTAGSKLMQDIAGQGRAKIPVERTTTPFDVFELTRKATEGIQATNTEELNKLILQLAQVTEGKQATIRDLATGIEKVAGAVNQRDAQLRSLLDEADKLSATLAEKDDTLVRLIDASSGVLNLVVQRRDALAAALGEGSDAVVELSKLVDRHKSELDAILTTVHELTGVIDPHLGNGGANAKSVDSALAWAGPGFLGQAKAGSHGPWQDVYIRALGPAVLNVLEDVYGQVLGTP